MAKDKVKIDNPFVTTGYAGANYFCDREKETQDITRFLSNGAKSTCAPLTAMRRIVLDTNCLLQALPSRSPYRVSK